LFFYDAFASPVFIDARAAQLGAPPLLPGAVGFPGVLANRFQQPLGFLRRQLLRLLGRRLRPVLF
jgi:hypothetical protein